MKLRHTILEMQIISRQFARIQIFTLILLFPVLSELGILFLSDIKSAISVASFKYRLNRDQEKPPRYYNIGTRIGQILHARLRMECRALNSHLYRKNIVPSPSCICCGFESPYHFFFVCSRYNAARNRYLPRWTSYLGWRTNQFLIMKHSFCRSKILLLTQEGVWILPNNIEKNCPSPCL